MTDPLPPAGVVITVTDIWREVTATRVEVQAALSEMRGIRERNKSADERHDDFEKRLRVLEKFQYKMLGAVLAIEVGGGVLEYFLLNHK